ncbi:hypothetical protein D1871_15150 [Nakamurella silvestris]|nr:hypothetical protein D1871_15150 [Nakamurella silvestris]
MTDPDELLADPARLQAADAAALLPGAATAGAQLRSIASTPDAWMRFDGFRPRALVVVAVGRAAADARLAQAILGGRTPVPFHVTAELPAWIGALDAVVVLSPDPDGGRPEIVEAVEIARRRGATVLARSSRFGPVAFAAGADLLVPGIGVPEVLAGISRVYLLLQIARACGLAPAAAPGEAERLADLADAEALGCSPAAETFVNPAKSLAAHVASGSGLFIGTDPVTAALAAHAALAVAELTARVPSVLGPVELAESSGLVRALQTTQDIFADPFDEDLFGEDSAPPTWHPAVLQLSDEAPAAGPERVLREAVGRFSSVLTLNGPAVTEPGGDVATILPAVVALLVRLDFAAVYLGLIDGQQTPLDSPAGLAPYGGNLHQLRPESVDRSRTVEEDLDQWT